MQHTRVQHPRTLEDPRTGEIIARSLWAAFAAWFLTAAILFGLVALAFGRLPEAIGCRAANESDSFVVDCQQMGDYEHAAFAFDLEPSALKALAAAKVVTLGTSRSQFAFSTEAVRRFFADRDIPAYRLGFGYREGSRFALRIMRKAKTHPRLALVNADPFFKEELSPPAAYLTSEPWRAWLSAWRIKIALGTREAFCAALLWKPACKGWRSTMYRVRSDGRWSGRNSFSVREGATAIDASPVPALAMPEDALSRARAFLDETGLPPACLVLTAVPNSQVDASSVAANLARELGAPLILPHVPGLRTIDGSHLDAESAERWSNAFLGQLEPVLHRCLGLKDDG